VHYKAAEGIVTGLAPPCAQKRVPSFDSFSHAVLGAKKLPTPSVAFNCSSLLGHAKFKHTRGRRGQRHSHVADSFTVLKLLPRDGTQRQGRHVGRVMILTQVFQAATSIAAHNGFVLVCV